MRNRFTRLLLVAIIAVTVLSAVAYAAPDPDGATIIAGTPETKSNTTPGNYTAQGGNITAINLTAATQTQFWQGFWGDVFGNLTLEDNSGDKLYSWNLTNATGEVYSSRTSAIPWSTVAGVTTCTVDESITGTGTDRVNNTFTNSAVSFDIGSVSIASACNTHTYTSNATQTARYQEIIVNATGVPSIYVTKINSSTSLFNGVSGDYQMIVPANSTTQVYYFFVEFD